MHDPKLAQLLANEKEANELMKFKVHHWVFSLQFTVEKKVGLFEVISQILSKIKKNLAFHN